MGRLAFICFVLAVVFIALSAPAIARGDFEGLAPRFMDENRVRSTAFYRQAHKDLALTIWAEARGEGEYGMRLVGHVVLNRVRTQDWGKSVSEVVRSPGQFSVWRGTSQANLARRAQSARDDSYRTAQRIADELLVNEALGTRRDRTRGATYFHKVGLRPDWSKNRALVATVGGHRFFAER